MFDHNPNAKRVENITCSCVFLMRFKVLENVVTKHCHECLMLSQTKRRLVRKRITRYPNNVLMAISFIFLT